MKIFITGATGVLGKRVTKFLIERGHEVFALSRSEQNIERIKALGAVPRQGDLFHAESLKPLVSDCEIILHLATKIPTKKYIRKKDWAENDRIRIEGTKNLLEALNPKVCKSFILQSIAFIYGNRQGGEVDEKSEVSTAQPYNLASTLVMEDLLQKGIKAHKIKGFALRFGWFYSSDSYQTASILKMLKKGMFGIIGKGDQFWNLIHVDDAAAAVVAAVENEKPYLSSILNIVDDEPVTMKILLNYLANEMNAPKPRYMMIWMTKLILGKAATSFLTASAKISNEKAKRELGWKPKFLNYKMGFAEILGSA